MLQAVNEVGKTKTMNQDCWEYMIASTRWNYKDLCSFMISCSMFNDISYRAVSNISGTGALLCFSSFDDFIGLKHLSYPTIWDRSDWSSMGPGPLMNPNNCKRKLKSCSIELHNNMLEFMKCMDDDFDSISIRRHGTMIRKTRTSLLVTSTQGMGYISITDILECLDLSNIKTVSTGIPIYLYVMKRSLPSVTKVVLRGKPVALGDRFSGVFPSVTELEIPYASLLSMNGSIISVATLTIHIDEKEATRMFIYDLETKFPNIKSVTFTTLEVQINAKRFKYLMRSIRSTNKIVKVILKQVIYRHLSDHVQGLHALSAVLKKVEFRGINVICVCIESQSKRKLVTISADNVEDFSSQLEPILAALTDCKPTYKESLTGVNPKMDKFIKDRLK